MKRKIDDLGRLVIPIEMREELRLYNGHEVNIELIGNKIIITNPKLNDKVQKAIDYANQIIKDTEGFYRPTTDTIYSGDTLIDIASQFKEILEVE